MFCMNCGCELPEGAKFCLQCGTPQGAVSPTGAINTDSFDLDGNNTFVPAMCPNCNAHMKVDSSLKIARCNSCGTECLVQDAIKALTIKGNVQVGNATINVNGTNTDSLLKRIEILLNDGDFEGVIAKCDSILDSEPTNGKAYFYMLMANLGCSHRDELMNQIAPFDGNPYYLKAMRYGDDSLKDELKIYIDNIVARTADKRNNPNRGDEFYFGTDKNGQRMWWEVLDNTDGQVFIVSRDIICNMPYHQLGGIISWEGCTLRKWLNNEFYNSVFTENEKLHIIPCLNDKQTNDSVFLLSVKEIKFLPIEDRKRECSWWLRSPDAASVVPFIDVRGQLCRGTEAYRKGIFVNNVSLGVRPAMVIKLD